MYGGCCWLGKCKEKNVRGTILSLPFTIAYLRCTVPPDVKFHDWDLPNLANECEPYHDTCHPKGYSILDSAFSICGMDAVRTPANDMVNWEATWNSKENGAKPSVSCRVGPNNADSKVVEEVESFAAWAF